MATRAWSAGAESPQLQQWIRTKLALMPDERVLDLAARGDESAGFQSYRMRGTEDAMSALYTDPSRKAYDKVVALNSDPLELERSGELKVLRLLLRPEGKAYLFLTPRTQQEATDSADRMAAFLWDAGLHVDEVGYEMVDGAWAACVVARRAAGAPGPLPGDSAPEAL